MKLVCCLIVLLGLSINVNAQSFNITAPTAGALEGNSVAVTTSNSGWGFFGVTQVTFSLPGLANIVVANSPFSATFNTSTLPAGTYKITAVATNGIPFVGTTITTSVSITIVRGPVITSQPTNQTVCSGSYTTFSVAATGTGLTYQWWVNGAPFAADHSDGNGTYTGSQTATLSISPGPGTYFDGSSIYCVVTNSNGSTNSNTVTLTRNTAPTITTQPVSKTVCAGNPTSFTVAASGTAPLTYQWQANGVNLVNGADGNGTYSGTQTATLNITPTAGTSYNGATITCIVTNLCSPPTTSNSATLTVVPLSAAFTLSSTSTGVGSAITVTYAGSEPATDTYTWIFSGGTPSTGTGQGPFSVQWAIAGTYTITLSTKNASGCTATTSQTVQVIGALTGYAFSKPLILNTQQISVGASNTGISATTPLKNFPALVYISDPALKIDTVCNNRVQYPYGNYSGTTTNPAGTSYDFAFTTPGTAGELPYQVDTYDQADGILLVWVQIPSMTSANVNLNFYFGNSAPTGHGSTFTQSTWYTDYLAVYHFNEGSTTLPVLDATSHVRNAVQTNTGIGNDEIHQQAGIPIVGGAYSFDGSTTQILQNAGTSPINPDATGTFTESAWVNPTNASADNKIVSDQLNYAGGYKLSVTSNKVVTETRAGTANSSPYVDYSAGAVSTGWTYIQGVWDGSHFINYVNGVATATGTGKAATAGGLLSMGFDNAPFYNTPNTYAGLMDEVRISNVVKTPDWIRAEYYNQSNPVTFTNYSGGVATYQTTAAAIPGALTYTWTGSAGDNNPATASNWNNTTSGVPNQAPASGSTLIIPTGTLKLSNDLTAYGITLNSGANVNLSGHVLNVACHIYNQATGIIDWSSSDASTINWNGSVPQNYYGNTGTSGYGRVGTMTVNNSTGSNITIYGDSLDVFHQLTITTGNIVVDQSGFMALKSSRIETANVNQIPSTYSITGNVTAERYIPGGTASYRNYRLLTLAVNGTSTINQNTGSGGSEAYINLSSLRNGMLTAGPGPAGTSGFSYGTRTTNPLMYLYDESKPQNFITYLAGKNVGVYSLSTTSPYKATYYANGVTASMVPATAAPIPVGNSVQVYYVGPSTESGLADPAPVGTTVTSTGYLNQGTIPIYIFSDSNPANTGNRQLSYHPSVNTVAKGLGLNQVGNPYPSTISLDQLYADNNTGATAIGPMFYEELEPGNTFVAYNGSSHTASVTPPGAQAYIASGQGFFVQAIASGSTSTSALTFYEDEKVNVSLGTATTPPLILSQKTKNLDGTAGSTISAAETLPGGLAGLHLQIAKDTATHTQTGIYFNQAWSDSYAPTEDAIDLDGSSVYLSSYSSDGIRLCINQLGDYSKVNKIVKLYASATSSGSYTLSLADIQNIDQLYNVYLRDHKLNDSVNLRTTNSYNFTINTGDTSTYGANRFDLVLEREALPPYQLLTFTGQKISSGVQLNWLASNAGTYTGFVLEKEGADNTFSPIYTTQSNNSSKYGFVDSNPVIGNNIYRLAQNDINGNITYSSLITIGYNNVTSNGYFSVYPNPSKDIINVLVNSTAATNTNYTADIYNTSGISMDHRILNTYSWTEDISSYKEGVYIIVLKNTNGDVLAKSKFIKVK